MTHKDDDLSELAKFFFELGQLKRTPRSGWLKLGIENPETVAEHSFRTAAIGFFLAKMEGGNPLEVAGYCLFHDLAETRTQDLDWLAQRYLDKGDRLSSEVLLEQLDRLPDELGAPLQNLFDQSEDQEDEIGEIARDADLLDLIFQALEYAYQGNGLAREWFENTVPLLNTSSGKRIGEFLKEKEQEGSMENLLAWWADLGSNEGQKS